MGKNNERLSEIGRLWNAIEELHLRIDKIEKEIKKMR